MTKSDLAWILLRFFGLYLLYATITGLFSAWVSAASINETYKTIREAPPSSARTSLNLALIVCFTQLVFGLYPGHLRLEVIEYQALYKTVV